MNFNLAKKAALGAGLLLAASAASAANVTYSSFADSDASAANFNLALNTIVGDQLNLGINNFKASGPGLDLQLDTVSFVVTANPGWVITKVIYKESGEGIANNGFAQATGSVVADGTPQGLATIFFASNQAGPWALGTTISIANKQSIAVSVTNSLAAAGGSIASIEKLAASFDVEVTAVPLPPALGMLGAGVLALATVGGRRRNNV